MIVIYAKGRFFAMKKKSVFQIGYLKSYYIYNSFFLYKS